jgi:hypothetical protein
VPSTNNGLLYTAEACVIMQLQSVTYDRTKIAAAVTGNEVKPGLFRRSPTDVVDTETPDDYVGLGALAGICGFQQFARDILNYGGGSDQASVSTVLGLSNNDFTNIRQTVGRCRNIPYNYNNVDPGKFTWGTWMGAYPAIITHWKLAAGDRPSAEEFSVWSAALIFSGKQDSPDQDHWLQSWLMVLTYEMSGYHSTVADFAVSQWWMMLHKRYPGGIRQTMTDYLAPGAVGNPFADYIQDFDKMRNPSAVMVDTDADAETLMNPVQAVFSKSCGEPSRVGACIDYTTFSPTNFLAPFVSALSTASAAVDVARQAVAAQQHALDIQKGVAQKASDLVASLNRNLGGLQAQQVGLQQQLISLTLQKASMIARQLDKLHLPGRWVTPCKTILGKCIPLGPPIFVPGKTTNNPNFDSLVGSIATLNSQASAVQSSIDQVQRQLGPAQQDLAIQNKAVDAMESKLAGLQQSLAKAEGALGVAKGYLLYVQAVEQDLIPCS